MVGTATITMLRQQRVEITPKMEVVAQPAQPAGQLDSQDFLLP